MEQVRTKVLQSFTQAPRRDTGSSITLSPLARVMDSFLRCGTTIPAGDQAVRLLLETPKPLLLSGLLFRVRVGGKVALPLVLVARLDSQDLVFHGKERVDNGGREVRAPPFSDDRERAIE